MEALAIVTIILGILHLLQYQAAQVKQRTLESDKWDAGIRANNAESIAQVYVEMRNELHERFMLHGYIRCQKCGRFSRYTDAYIDREANAFLCKGCAQKSLDKKVQNV